MTILSVYARKAIAAFDKVRWFETEPQYVIVWRNLVTDEYGRGLQTMSHHDATLRVYALNARESSMPPNLATLLYGAEPV